MAFKLSEAFVEFKSRGLNNVNRDATKATSKLRFAKIAADKFNKSLSFRGLKGAASAIPGVGAAVGALGGAAGALVAAGAMVKMAADAELLQRQMATFTGSAESAKDIIDELNDRDITSVFDSGTVKTMARNMLALGMSSGDVLKDLDSLGNVSALSGAKIESVALAFSQASGKGILLDDDIRQMQNQGIPILQILADEMNVAKTEIMGLASNGKISFATLRAAMRNAGSAGGAFANGMKKIADTTSVKFNKLKGDFFKLAKGIGESLMPLANTIMDFASDTIAAFKWIWDNWDLASEALLEKSTITISNMWGEFSTFFDNMVSRFKWIFDNWSIVWRNMAEVATTALINVGENVTEVFDEVLGWIKSGGTNSIDMNFKGLGDGLKLKKGGELNLIEFEPATSAKMDSLLQHLGDREKKKDRTFAEGKEDSNVTKSDQQKLIEKGTEAGVRSAQSFGFNQLNKNIQMAALTKNQDKTNQVLNQNHKDQRVAVMGNLDQNKLTAENTTKSIALQKENNKLAKKQTELLTGLFNRNSTQMVLN